MKVIKKSHYQIQDILLGQLNNDEKSAHKEVQLSHIQKNKMEFQQLAQTLKDRKLTFAKFGFRQTEMIDDKKLGPVLRGICLRQSIGSMQVTELIPRNELKLYLNTSSLEPSKRVLKRYAHWEWDNEQESKKELPKYQFSGKVESDFKKQVQAKDADKRQKRQIYKKWSEHLPDFVGLTKFGKQFTFQTATTTHKTRSQESVTAPGSFNIAPRMSQSGLNLSSMICELDNLKTDNGKDLRKLRVTLGKLQTIIQKQEQRNDAKRQSDPF